MAIGKKQFISQFRLTLHDEPKMAKMRPKVAKMRLKMAKMRPKMAKMRP